MNLLSLIQQRQSTRNYDSKQPVPKEDVLYCLEAVRLSPSATNSQPYFFHICEGQTAKEISKATQSLGMNRFTDEAPMMVVISEAPYNVIASAGSRIKNQDYRALDIGIAAISFCLAATERKLGTCMLGWFDEKKIQQTLGINERIRLVISVGYPKDSSLRRKKRKTLSELSNYPLNE